MEELCEVPSHELETKLPSLEISSEEAIDNYLEKLSSSFDRLRLRSFSTSSLFRSPRAIPPSLTTSPRAVPLPIGSSIDPPRDPLPRQPPHSTTPPGRRIGIPRPPSLNPPPPLIRVPSATATETIVTPPISVRTPPPGDAVPLPNPVRSHSTLPVTPSPTEGTPLNAAVAASSTPHPTTDTAAAPPSAPRADTHHSPEESLPSSISNVHEASETRPVETDPDSHPSPTTSTPSPSTDPLPPGWFDEPEEPKLPSFNLQEFLLPRITRPDSDIPILNNNKPIERLKVNNTAIEQALQRGERTNN